jgi:hypothetical protein
MFNKYFGNYILRKNIINHNDLKTVLEKQHSTRVKLGVLAIESGYMSAAEVTKVHRLQSVQDKRFGEIAIEEAHVLTVKI